MTILKLIVPSNKERCLGASLIQLTLRKPKIEGLLDLKILINARKAHLKSNIDLIRMFWMNY